MPLTLFGSSGWVLFSRSLLDRRRVSNRRCVARVYYEYTLYDPVPSRPFRPPQALLASVPERKRNTERMAPPEESSSAPAAPLVVYTEKNAAYAALSTEQRIALLQSSKQQAVTEEEREKRQADAEALDAKLRHIVEELPDREYSRMGSMAGANSKTFDQYRSAKRREELRVAAMEQAAARVEAQRRFEAEVGGKNAAEALKTEKRRAKREKEKARKRAKQQGKNGGTGENDTKRPPPPDAGAPVVQPGLD